MNQISILDYEINPFQGAVVEASHFSGGSDEFAGTLSHTFREIEKKELQLVWLYLSVHQAGLVPVAVNLGFSYHHADDNGLQLVKKVTPGAFVPGYATHYIGVGGVLIDTQNRILVIQERYHTRRHYKLPGGALDPGEHISQAAVREVFEETGIQSEFLSLNCFRHWHGYRYGKSDIYFVCSLKPLSSSITIDPGEISEALWMPVDEYLNNPETHPFNRRIVEISLNHRGLKPGTISGYGSPETHELMF